MKLAILIASGSLLAGASGYLASVALSQTGGAPTSTTTVNVATGSKGEPGPPGPVGPPGPAGPVDCGAGFHVGLVVVNHPGGQLTMKACVKNA